MGHINTDQERKKWLETLPRRVSSATLILETEKGQVIVEKAHYKQYWSFPGGIVDPGETPQQTAIREVREEIGLVIDADDVTFIAIATRSSTLAETYQFIFHAKIHSDVLSKIVLQNTEIEAWDLATKDQILAFDKVYSQAVMHWVTGKTGYIEQSFGKVD